MGKYLIGDIVRLKTKKEILAGPKSFYLKGFHPMYPCCGKIFKIIGYRNPGDKSTYRIGPAKDFDTYSFTDMENYVWPEQWFESVTKSPSLCNSIW